MLQQHVRREAEYVVGHGVHRSWGSFTLEQTNRSRQTFEYELG